MQNAIKREIKRLSDRALARLSGKSKTDQEYRDKFEKRTGRRALLSKSVPLPYITSHFDPIHCKRNANFIAKTIWYKFQNLSYQPNPAIEFFIDKPNGGKRRLMAFSIPDAALANVLMRRLRERNIKRFSPHSFAYHPDKNVFDAILDLRGFVISTPKIYSVQIDFKDYFDSIPKRYLQGLLLDKSVLASTPAERHAVSELLSHRYGQRTELENNVFLRRLEGTPQGSSISLILANLASHALDTQLEKLSGKFVRFADDVTALTASYEDAVQIENAFFEHCRQSGISMNKEKSPGINILSDQHAEIRTVSNIDYLGYRFTPQGLTLSRKAIKRIKSKISKLASIYLVQYVRDVDFNHSRVNASGLTHDWDLLGFMSEVRNYLYGGLSENELKSMIWSGKKLRKVTGLMSFYCLLDDKNVLSELDGWLLALVRRASRHRSHLIKTKTGRHGLLPSRSELILGTWMSPDAWDGNDKPDFTLPSFVRGWRAARKYYLTFGLKEVEPPKYEYAYTDMP